MIQPPTTAPGPVAELERAVTQLRALEWLTRQPLDRLPLMRWVAQDDGSLVGSPVDVADCAGRHAFEGWVAHLRLEADPPRRFADVTRLRAWGRVDGVLVIVQAECRWDAEPLGVPAIAQGAGDRSGHPPLV